MRSSRLASAAAALLLVAAALAAVTRYVRWTEARSVHPLAAQMFAQKNYGAALQRAAFQQTDLLPFYGSSELNVRNRFHASALFRDYPTGFTVFPVGNVGSTSLIWLQALAAVGADVRGKKVAMSLPARSFITEGIESHAYAANFSRLHASELVFGSGLSFAVKQAVARRMLQYPATLTGDRLLRFALERLADGSFLSRALYYASVPLGTLQTAVLRLQDDWSTLAFVRAQIGLTPGPRMGADLDWTALRSEAERETRRASEGNPFGFASAFWATHAADIASQKNLYRPETALQNLERSAEWTDVDLLLRVIRELGGEPLLLSPPLNGAFYDYLGIDEATRSRYYDRLRALANAHDVRVIDFAEHDSDTPFTIDPALHLSDTGWVHYGQALNAFFHGRDPDRS